MGDLKCTGIDSSVLFCIQLFQLTLSDQSTKLQVKTEGLRGIFFMNKFIKISFASPVSEDLRWRAIWMKEMLGYQVDELAAALRRPLSFKL